jgi:hypothetical protein
LEVNGFLGAAAGQPLEFYNRLKLFIIKYSTVGQRQAEAHRAGREEAGIIYFYNFE